MKRFMTSAVSQIEMKEAGFRGKHLLRMFSSAHSDKEWRQAQLESLTRKFEGPLVIDNDDDVQPMWKQMESRVLRRKSLTHDERRGISGRRNVRETDEEAWMNAGLYDAENSATVSSERKSMEKPKSAT